jgi:hypothetical protein
MATDESCCATFLTYQMDFTEAPQRETENTPRRPTYRQVRRFPFPSREKAAVFWVVTAIGSVSFLACPAVLVRGDTPAGWVPRPVGASGAGPPVYRRERRDLITCRFGCGKSLIRGIR